MVGYLDGVILRLEGHPSMWDSIYVRGFTPEKYKVILKQVLDGKVVDIGILKESSKNGSFKERFFKERFFKEVLKNALKESQRFKKDALKDRFYPNDNF